MKGSVNKEEAKILKEMEGERVRKLQIEKQKREKMVMSLFGKGKLVSIKMDKF
jgi:predicted glycosyltransferase involved in capsule biosynthesis